MIPDINFAPSPEELRAGAAADRLVEIYERYIRPHQWQYALVLPGIFVLLIGVVFFHIRSGHSAHNSFFIMLPALMTGFFTAQYSKKQHASDKDLLHWLEKTYGDALPWVVERKQLAASDELEAAIRQYKSETKA